MGRTLLGLLLVSTVLGANAKMYHIVLDRDDRKLIHLTDAFNFTRSGKLDITIRDIAIDRLRSSTDATDRKDFGFFLSPVESDAALEEWAENANCILDGVNHLFTFKIPSVQNVIDGNLPETTFHFVTSYGGAYYLCFANCENDTPVSFTADIVMYNADSNATEHNALVMEKLFDGADGAAASTRATMLLLVLLPALWLLTLRLERRA